MVRSKDAKVNVNNLSQRQSQRLRGFTIYYIGQELAQTSSDDLTIGKPRFN